MKPLVLTVAINRDTEAAELLGNVLSAQDARLALRALAGLQVSLWDAADRLAAAEGETARESKGDSDGQ